MIDAVLVIASAFGLGFLHGLGADHLMAIAALAGGDARVARSRAVGVAVRFATGHAVVLGLGAAAAVVAGWSIPAGVEQGGEIAGGLLLIVLGAIGLWALATGRIYSHAHAWPPRWVKAWHLHVGQTHHHTAAGSHGSAVPTIVGAVFAVSSLRALTLLAPFAGRAAGEIPLLVGLIAFFAAGILLSMSLFGVALARVMSTRLVALLGRAAGALVSAGSIALGLFWMAASF
jgi:nickel/cobalt exporter